MKEEGPVAGKKFVVVAERVLVDIGDVEGMQAELASTEDMIVERSPEIEAT